MVSKMWRKIWIFSILIIFTSLVSFTLEFWPFLDGHMMPISNHILLLRIKFVLSSQLLPTLDIYTWTEEHVVGISVFTCSHLNCDTVMIAIKTIKS